MGPLISPALKTLAQMMSPSVRTQIQFLGAALAGTGILTVEGESASTTIGIGTAQPGIISLSATDLSNITNGWADIVIGRSDATGDVNIRCELMGMTTLN